MSDVVEIIGSGVLVFLVALLFVALLAAWAHIALRVVLFVWGLT